jgi:acyl-CoA reductase-like NAD-dependent aldehyde dehydrogenase
MLKNSQMKHSGCHSLPCKVVSITPKKKKEKHTPIMFQLITSLCYLILGYLIFRFVKWVMFRLESPTPLPPFRGQRTILPLVTWSKQKIENGKNVRMIECVNPGTMEKLCDDVAAMDEQDVKLRVDASRKVQQEVWCKTSFAERRRVMKIIMQHILDNKHEIAKTSCLDSGKTLFEAHLGEIMLSCEKIRYLINFGEEDLKPESRRVPLFMIMKKAQVEYHPLGVIGMIVPWNYPFHNVLGSLVTSLFAGNGVVVKVSEWTTYSLVHCFERILHEALIKAGYNPDLIGFVVGYGDTGAHLIRSGVDHVFFIGSPATGKKVMATAAENLTPLTLELGGKDAFIICEDTDLDNAVDYALRSIFINCGQNCVAAERFYVHEKIYDKFVQAAVEQTKKLRQGPTNCSKIDGFTEDEMFEMGAMTMKGEVERIEKMINEAVERGAKLEIGGKRNTELKGDFMLPTILTNVSQEMKIVQEEVFGPVMLVIKWKDDEEVIKMANGTPFGLGSYVFCKNYTRAHYIANKLIAGVTMVNDYGVFYLIQSLPFGGTKISGFGKFGGREGLRAFSNQKAFITDRFPIQMTVPPFMRYPTRPFSHLIVADAVDLLYGNDLSAKVKHLYRLIKNIIAAGKPDAGTKKKN